MEYKIFRVTYNDGGWHSGDLPHFYYIAQNEEEVCADVANFLAKLGEADALV